MVRTSMSPGHLVDELVAIVASVDRGEASAFGLLRDCFAKDSSSGGVNL